MRLHPSLHQAFIVLSAAAGLSLCTLPALAQAAASAPAAAAIDTVKQKIIDQILAVFHPETVAVVRAQQLGSETMQKAGMMLQQNHIPKDKGQKTMKDIATDVQKYIDVVTPIVAADAKAQVGPAVSPILAQNFTVDELRQILAMYQMPVKAKLEKLVPDMEGAVFAKVQADVGAEVEKDAKAMNQSAGIKLQSAVMTN